MMTYFRSTSPRRRAFGAVALLIAAAIGSSCSPSRPTATFATLVDQYLDDFARRHPSIAAGNGL
ncbi:MAG: hypothetical protein EBV77_08965, partial [Gemmatimonadaceae bacterium]|nr:hypothetical protein [Gemmatimonadaceae bacterium]